MKRIIVLKFENQRGFIYLYAESSCTSSGNNSLQTPRVGAHSLVTNQCQHAHTLVSVASHMHVELFQAIVLMGMVIGLNVAFILKNMNNVVKVGFFRC